VIYVARNPKDAIVSFFYFHKLVKLCYYAGEMDDFVDYFLNNKRKTRTMEKTNTFWII
jgi:hypothetical protein